MRVTKLNTSLPALTKELYLQVMALVHTINANTPSFCDMSCSCPLECPSCFAEISWCSWTVSKHLHPLSWKFLIAQSAPGF